MWYGSLVSRHGSDRPWARYHRSSVRRNQARARGSGRRRTGRRGREDARWALGIGAKGSRYNRSVKIYTRTGDAGETSLFDGTRVSKANPRVDAYGHIDELNAVVGQARAAGLDAWIDERLNRLQLELFAVGAALADPTSRIAARVT